MYGILKPTPFLVQASRMHAGFRDAAQALRGDDDRVLPARARHVPGAGPGPHQVQRLHPRAHGHGHPLLRWGKCGGGHHYWRSCEGVLVLDVPRDRAWQGEEPRRTGEPWYWQGFASRLPVSVGCRHEAVFGPLVSICLVLREVTSASVASGAWVLPRRLCTDRSRVEAWAVQGRLSGGTPCMEGLSA